MSDPNSNQPAEELTPEARAIIGKARRSFAISMGILLLGFMAIGFALVYRVMRDKPSVELAAQIEMPAGAEVLSAVVSDGSLNVTYRANGIVHLRLVDQVTGVMIREVEFKGQ